MSNPSGLEVGDVVYWYESGDTSQKPRAAMVTAIGVNGSLCLNVFDSNSWNLRVFDGVYHLEDEGVSSYQRIESGAWDYTPRLKKLMALLAGSKPPAAGIKVGAGKGD